MKQVASIWSLVSVVCVFNAHSKTNQHQVMGADPTCKNMYIQQWSSCILYWQKHIPFLVILLHYVSLNNYHVFKTTRQNI